MGKWNDDKIKKALEAVISGLGINRFPTHKEMSDFYGYRGLSNAISKGHGSIYWAERLGVQLKYSETTFGNRFERIAKQDILINTGLDSVVTSNNHPYDILTDNSLEIDVKVAKIFRNNTHIGSYEFNLEKKEPTCDIFILYCVDSNESIKKTLIIPSCSLLGQIHIGVGEISKWDVFNGEWHLVEEYCDFFRKYKQKVI